tara:strand:- start:1091 stop:1357 length:267 start_codon:yes stop_codon:yes gene_type:complete
MQKEKVFLVELTESQIDGMVTALDTVVKSHGLSVAEKCAEIHRCLSEANLKVEPVEVVEEISLEEVEDELEQIMQVPKKRKRSTKKKK